MAGIRPDKEVAYEVYNLNGESLKEIREILDLNVGRKALVFTKDFPDRPYYGRIVGEVDNYFLKMRRPRNMLNLERAKVDRIEIRKFQRTD